MNQIEEEKSRTVQISEKPVPEKSMEFGRVSNSFAAGMSFLFDTFLVSTNFIEEEETVLFLLWRRWLSGDS